jgi:uncharacterized protein YjdB
MLARRARAILAVFALAACSGSDQGPAAVATVSVTLAATTIEETRTTTATAVTRDADGAVLTGREVTWSTGNNSIASVSSAGVVTGVGVGSTTVTATSEGKTGSATITVILRPVMTVSVTLNPANVVAGATSQATAVTRDADNNVLTGRAVTFSSGNTAVATVNPTTGLVTTLSAGSTTITATSEGIAGGATLTVVPPPVATVTVALNPTSVVAGGVSQATFVARDAANNVLSGRVGTWSSSNQSVATVNPATGAITALAAGVTNITATVEGQSGSAQLTVTTPAVGTVTGTVTAADGVTPIGDALVEVEGSGGLGSYSVAAVTISTRSAPNGTYTLQNVPVGPQVIRATRGAFLARVNVTVVANQSIVAPNAALVTQGKLAYVAGVFDNIENIVSNSLGNPIEEIQVADLANSAVTSQYRIIFLNCGLDESMAGSAAIIANLRAFMQAGGTIYASDWASIYVKDLFPTYNYDQVGDDQTIQAAVTDASLQAFVGKTSVTIVYDLASWTDILALPTGATVLLRGTYTSLGTQRVNQPIAFVVAHGSGRLVFTTFHNEAGATQDQIAVLRHFIYLP